MSIKDFLKPAPYINNTNPINTSDRAKDDYNGNFLNLLCYKI